MFLSSSPEATLSRVLMCVFLYRVGHFCRACLSRYTFLVPVALVQPIWTSDSRCGAKNA